MNHLVKWNCKSITVIEISAKMMVLTILATYHTLTRTQSEMTITSLRSSNPPFPGTPFLPARNVIRLRTGVGEARPEGLPVRSTRLTRWPFVPDLFATPSKERAGLEIESLNLYD